LLVANSTLRRNNLAALESIIVKHNISEQSRLRVDQSNSGWFHLIMACAKTPFNGANPQCTRELTFAGKEGDVRISYCKRYCDLAG